MFLAIYWFRLEGVLLQQLKSALTYVAVDIYIYIILHGDH